MNNLNTRQKVLLGILAIVIFFYIYTTFVPDNTIPTSVGTPNSSFDRPPVSTNLTVPANRNVTPKAVTQISGSITSGQLKKFDGDWGKRDPFYRKVEKIIVEGKPPEETLGFVLTGVQWINGKPIAVINNIIHREGDVVDGKKITKIEKDYIVLRDENKEYILRIGGE